MIYGFPSVFSGSLRFLPGPIFSGIATSGYRDLSGYRDQWDIARDDIATSKKVQNLDYSSSSPSPAGHPVILFSGRLVSGDDFPFVSPVPASSHSLLRMPVFLGASLFFPRLI